MPERWIWPRAVVVDHYDGDTFYCNVDLGRRTSWLRGSIRLARLDAPELYVVEWDAEQGKNVRRLNPPGADSRSYLRALLPIGTRVSLESVGYDKYADRVDAEVILLRGHILADGYALPDGLNINDAMVKAGHAVYRDY